MTTVAAQALRASARVISEEEFAKFNEFFYRQTGISLTDRKGYFVERRIQERLEKTGARSFGEYFNTLRFQASGEELQHLVNAMTVNETYFFREDYQFKALIDGVLPEIARTRPEGSTISIWSVPCSTGEEPYSIAIQILENWDRADDFGIEIRASDIDTRVLMDARQAVYSDRAIHRLTPALREKYFSAAGPGRFQLREEIRGSVDFSAVNVANPAQMARYREIDVIFCRNMLIYFDDLSRRQTVEAFYDCLKPGGFLCLGHSESMSRISSLFTPRSFAGTIIYQKARGAD